MEKENQWQKGVMIHRKPRENYFTMIQFDTLKLHFLFPKVILYLIHDYYFEGYQIAIHINHLVISPVWKSHDDIHPTMSFDDLDNNDIPNTQDVLNESFQNDLFFQTLRIKGLGQALQTQFNQFSWELCQIITYYLTSVLYRKYRLPSFPILKTREN